MSYAEDEVAEEVDDTPDWVKEGTEDEDVVIEGEDVSQAQVMSNEDFIDPAKNVTFEITKALLDTFTPNDKTDWMKRSLKLYVAVTKEGVDGKGRYARKNFFPRILVAVNRDAYDFTKDWYKPKVGGAWGEYNELLTALGLPTNPSPRNDNAFRASLVGRKFVADISKDKRETFDKVAKKYVKVDGEFENHLRNLRPAKEAQAATTETATEAAVA